MEPIRILIADDDPGMRTVMRLLVERSEGYLLSGEAADGDELLRLYDQTHPQVILMDVEMPGMSGIDCARVIQDRDPRTVLVFATAHEEYMRSAFEVYAFDYLVKPYQTSQLEHVLSGAIRLMEESEPQVEIRMPRQTVRMPHRQIAAIASHGHTLDVFTVSGACLKSTQTFAELEAMLQGDERFLPCNRGVLVNMDEALKLDGDSIILMNGMRFPIRQRNRLEMVNRFSEYQIRRMKRG